MGHPLYIEVLGGLLAALVIGAIVKMFFRLSVVLAIVIALAVVAYLNYPIRTHAVRLHAHSRSR